MIRKFFIFIALSIIAQCHIKAQYDTYSFYQGINQMYMNMYQQQQTYNQMIMDAVNAEVKRRDANATASCIILPQGEDRFFVHVALVYINGSNISISVEDELGFSKYYDSDSYAIAGPNIITNSIMEPGSTIYVRRKDTNKLLAKASIPSKDSPNYERFLANAYVISQKYSDMISSNMGGNSISTFNNSSDYSTRRSKETCSFCNGKGWRAGSKTPTYGSTTRYWCEECDRMVNPSHSHDTCPSCMGKGYIIK